MDIFSFDIKTIIGLLAISNLITFAVLLCFMNHFLMKRQYNQFIIGIFSLSIGWLLLDFRDQISNLLSVYIGNTLLAGGFALQTLAIVNISELNRKRENLFAGIVIIGLLIFWFFTGTPGLWIAISSLINLFIFGTGSYFLFLQSRGSGLRKFLGSVLAAHAIFLLLRMILGFMDQQTFSLMNPNIVQSLTFSAAFTYTFISGIGFLLLFKEQGDRLLSESEEKYRLMTEGIKDVAWVLDTETMFFTYVSPSIVKLRGYTPEEILAVPMDNSLTQLVSESVKNLIRKRSADFLSGKKSPDKHYIDELEQPCKDGSIVYTEAITNFYFNSATGHVELRGITRDITDRKLAEKEIKRKNEQLYELNISKDKFFSIIAHDLKSPFQGLLGMTEIMVSEEEKLEPEDVSKYNRNIRNSVVNLYKLVENLLAWARFQKGAISFSPVEFSLSESFSQSVESIKIHASQKGINFINQIPVTLKVFADENMINTVFRNLLSNAVKFTRNGGEIVGKARNTELGMVEFSLTDTGVGIPADFMEKLFKLGENVGTKGTDNESSTGLGLLLCKDFVEKHGGKIWAESEEEKGSTFYFTIPLRV